MTRPAPHGMPTRGEWIAVAIAATAYLAFCSFRDGAFIWLLSQQEGGVWLDESMRVLRGERMYRDFFDFVAPGNVYLIAGALWILGETTRSVGWLVVATGVAGALLVHAVAARLLPRAWRACATALFLVHAYQPYSPLNHKWVTFLLCMSALLLVLDRRSVPRCIAAGVALAAASLCTQDMGASAALALAAALLLLRSRETPRPLLVYCAAYVATLLAASAAIALHAGCETWWYHVYVFSATRYVLALGVSFGDPHAAIRTFTVYALGALGIAFTLLGAARGRWRTAPAELLLVALLGVGLLLGSLARHIEPVSFGVRAMPLILVGMYALRVALERRRGDVPAIAFFVLTLGPTAAMQLVHAQLTRPLARAEHRAGAIWEPGPMGDLAWLESHAAAGAPVFLLPYKGGYEFLSRTRNASFLTYAFDMDFTTQAQMQRAAAQIAASCATVGLWDHGRLADPIERSSLRPLYERLLEDYESRGRLAGNVELLARRPGRAQDCPRAAPSASPGLRRPAPP